MTKSLYRFYAGHISPYNLHKTYITNNTTYSGIVTASDIICTWNFINSKGSSATCLGLEEIPYKDGTLGDLKYVECWL